MTTAQAAQDRLNAHAREAALRSVSRPLNLAAPTLSYQAHGPVLVFGPEHRVRRAIDLIGDRLVVCALISEAMPAAVDAEMEAAATLVPEARLVRLPLVALRGYLGRFEVEVKVADQSANLAELETGSAYFAAVLDLGSESWNQAQLKPAGYLEATTGDTLAAAVDQLISLQGEFEKPRYFRIHSDLCAHAGATLTGCTRCLSVCPADAIQSRDGAIAIDAHLCHGAGGCATACPTGAIQYAYPQPQQTLDACRRLLQHYRDAGGASPRLLIHDSDSGAVWYREAQATLDPSWLGLEIEEQGAAGIELWLSALAWGAVEVALLAPASLPASIRTSLEAELDIANRLLDGMHLNAAIRLLTPDQLLQPVVARDSLVPAPELNSGNDKRRQLSEASAWLFNHSPLGSGPQTRIPLPGGAAYGQVALHDSRCTLCMACVSICPTQALGAGRDAPQLSFVEDACVQCGLCVQACPEDALQLAPSYQLDPLPRQQQRILKREEPFCCTRCGKPFATQGAVALMLEKLAGHSMFGDGGLERLKMCGDCRVADLIVKDPGADLFEYAKGREQRSDEINLVQIQDGKA